MNNVLLVNGHSGRCWIKLLRQAVRNMGGTLKSLDQRDVKEATCAGFDLIILDASVVGDLLLMVKRIRGANRSARIVVVSPTPHWKEARDLYLEGGTTYERKEDDLTALMGILQDSLSRAPLARWD